MATPNEKSSSLVDYEVHVKTSGDMNSGTDANVFISLIGDKTTLSELQLKSTTKKDLFERDSLDVFVLDKLVDIGKVCLGNLDRFRKIIFINLVILS